MNDLLEKFKKVIEVGNITRASKELNISQPALTMSLNKLEKEFDAHLLVRSKKGIYPTEMGKCVYRYASKIHNNIESLQREIDELKEHKSLILNVGMIDYIAMHFLSDILKTFPHDIKFNIHINNSTELVRMLEVGEIDFAITTMPKSKLHKQFTISKLGSHSLHMCVSTDSVEKITNVQDLRKKSFITYNAKSYTYKLIHEALVGLGIEPNYIAHSTSPTVSLELVKLGKGIGILPRKLISDDLHIIELPKLEFTRELALITPHDVYLSDVSKQFIERLEELITSN